MTFFPAWFWTMRRWPSAGKSSRTWQRSGSPAALNELLDLAENEPRRARQLRLLASACLEVGAIDPDTTARIDAGRTAIIPPRNSRESRSLSLGGDRTLRNLPPTLGGTSEAEAIACVRTAALINGPAAMRLLTAYAPDPRWLVQGELAEIWRSSTPREYATKVLANAPLQDGLLWVTQPEHVRYTGALPQLTAPSHSSG